MLFLNLSQAQTNGLKNSGNSASSSNLRDSLAHALDNASNLERDGKYADALKLRILFHKNVLNHFPGYASVRLSFALSDWADLGKIYPPARVALRAVRNETAARYKKVPSDSGTFRELMSIDMALNDLKSAKLDFYLGKKHGVNDRSFLLDLDRVLQTGDQKWAMDIIGDPTELLKKIKRSRDSNLSAHKKLSGPLNEMYATQIVSVLKVVAKVQGRAAGLKLQQEALKVLDLPSIRNALNGL